ncbi:MAG: hypothetical protein E7388_06885 [Ruminococcaceae bacterium]|nr:hypothetical protein [Oscillospiraceae bacterium]
MLKQLDDEMNHNLFKKIQGQCFFYNIKNLFSVPYAVIKGEALSKQAYGSVGQRTSSDIDILVSRKYLNDIELSLLSAGFENTQKSRQDRILMLSNSHQVAPWIKVFKPWGYLVVDLNFDIFWGEYEGTRINIEEFLSDTIDVDIYENTIKALSPPKAMVQLVLHNYKDMNSVFLLTTRNRLKKTMFEDLYYLLKNNLDTISIEKLYTISEEYKIIPYVFYMFYYTSKIFNDDILKRYVEAFRTKEGDALLDFYGLCDKERKEWKCDFETRLKSKNIFDLIKNDLTEKDKEKIAINKRIFMGVEE